MSSAGESTSELTADLATESGGTGSDTVGSSGSDSRATSANRAITEYIELAKKKKQQLKVRPKRIGVSRATPCLDYEEQIMIPVGRMYYCHKRKKGVHDRQYATSSIVCRKDMNYKRVLEKCTTAVFPDDDQEAVGVEYYVANGRGICICDSNDEIIKVDNSDGGEEHVPWTLQTYIKLSSGRYASRTRLYCVKKFETENLDVPTELSETEPMLHDDVEISGVPAKVEEGNGSKTTSELGETVETAAETLEEVVQVEQTVTQALGEIVQVGEMEQTVTLALGEMEQTVTLALGETVRVGETAALALGETVHVEQTVTQAPEVQIGETITMEESENVGHMKQVFEPVFAFFNKSRYEDKYIMVSPLSQIPALEYELPHGNDVEFIGENKTLDPQNPCMFGSWIIGIRKVDTRDVIIDLVEDYDVAKGKIIYKSPSEGTSLHLWTGAEVSSQDHVALFMCVATSGYHSISSYQWKKDGNELPGEIYPILYTTSAGTYECYVVTGTETNSRFFEVESSMSSAQEIKATFGLDFLLPYNIILPSDCQESNVVRMLDEIGQGSFGTVHKAVWRGCLVAAKVIQVGQESKKFMDEVEKCQKLQHPNIIPVMGHERMKDGKLAIMMRFIDGPNLHDIIFGGEAKLDQGTKIYMALQLCQAIMFMHSNVPPIAHLDIKPSNILIEKGTSKLFLGDFGLAQVMSDTNIIGTRTMLAGTPGFQSPEQLRNESVGLPSDVYALGAVLLVLFGESPVWPTLAPYQIMYKVAVCKEKPQTTTIPPKVRDICNKCFDEVCVRPTVNMVFMEMLQIIG